MEQHFMLLSHLLLLSIKNNSSEIVAIATTRTPTAASALNTEIPIDSTLHHNLRHHHHPSASTSLATLQQQLLVTMGSCFGRLATKEPTTATSACLWRQATDEQEAELMEPDEEETNPKKKKFIFRIIKFKHKEKRKQFMQKFWQHQEKNYSKLGTGHSNQDSTSEIQLQNLDVNNLLNCSTLAAESVINAANSSAQFSSRTSSSLDLEWEHEYVSQLRPYPFALLPPTATANALTRLHSTASHASAGAAAQAAVHFTTPTRTNSNDIDLDSWQFLSQCRHFDDEALSFLQQSQSLRSSPLVSKTAATTGTESSPREPLELPYHLNEMEPIKPFPNAGPNKLHPYNKLQQHQQMLYQQRGVARPCGYFSSFTRTSSRTSCSHISTPESLEWDIDEEQQRQMHVEDDNLGLETLQLLHQIEQLKKKVLNETGDGLFDARDDLVGFANVREEYIEETDIS